ncbi:hypothetical protein SLINC_7896 [Streptomyces lincolnensis]|uniref:Uncharacterized protein n=1 Tax=Streptomyces lincolnensis TaxID=1915 RepID=A0A1B1MNC9_STRLN|nr:hypothetical protein [Streptomyces lincolnensis]ANS70120.1 hypothetical protein SLINC_7896 [Streptomyces lincolnensis]AXG59017.1 hypothetical protein SLCG_7862 [Streptomyces lincolnensis]QMV11615.1 hypothetical protein GJU35_42015 [Streptomyces lincolnensis]
MRGARRTEQWFWRWRSNPLRRRDDVLDAWLVTAVWALIIVGGTLCGAVTGRAADGVFAQQRAERTAVRAVLLTGTPQAASNSYRSVAKVRWTARDGSTRTGKTLVKAGRAAGSRMTVWTDARGELTTEPPSRGEAAVESALLGASAALASSGLVVGIGGAARWRLNRRRIDSWGTEWALVGPQWGHKIVPHD